MHDTGITGGWHRARATGLGATAALVILVAAYAAWGGMLGELHRLERRSTVHTPDALPVLFWAALVLALLWAALLVVLATATLLGASSGGSGGDDGSTRGDRRAGGMIGRLAAILLAVTALSSLSTAAQAFAATPSAVSTSVVATTSAMASGVGTAADQDTKPVAATKDSCGDDNAPTPGWVPDKPTRTDQVARDCAPLVTGKPVADDSGEVVVHRGDTLWSIAAAHLGPHADAQAIAAEWPHWYAANRDVIGNDPDLLAVGTRLLTPDHALEGSNR
ncbi:LysM peptidoglycan-binding domain-containing protein [Flexivirga alba]|uniref:LysM peptidoglycan-binding domain-containing protein n=1 Tax=Flexivirga alba TaxID=702742 RepID=A0ABW2ALX2_9MICO